MKNKKYREILYYLFTFIPFPILCGRLKGKLWILGCSSKIFRFLTTTYESPVTHLFENIVKEGDVIYDIGAHVGYFTLLFSVLVGNKGKVVAFEPNKKNLEILKRHLKINRCKNVIVVDKAVSDKTGITFFDTGDGSWTGKISLTGEYEVEVVKLDDFISKNLIPSVIKIDVEGEELNVLRGAKNLLEKYKPTIFLSTHSQELYEKCSVFLKSLNYEIHTIETMKDLIIAK